MNELNYMKAKGKRITQNGNKIGANDGKDIRIDQGQVKQVCAQLFVRDRPLALQLDDQRASHNLLNPLEGCHYIMFMSLHFMSQQLCFMFKDTSSMR